MKKVNKSALNCFIDEAAVETDAPLLQLDVSQSVNVTSGDDIRENEENTDGMMQHTNVTRPPGQTGSVSTGLRKQLIFVFHIITHWKY